MTVLGCFGIFAALILSELDVHAQVRVSGLSALGGGIDPGATPRFGVEYILPEVHKWYAPRHIFETYSDPWYVRDTGYEPSYWRARNGMTVLELLLVEVGSYIAGTRFSLLRREASS